MPAMSEKSLSERMVAFLSSVVLIGDEFFGDFAGVFSGDAVDLGSGDVTDEEVAHNWRVDHVDGDHVALHVLFAQDAATNRAWLE